MRVSGVRLDKTLVIDHGLDTREWVFKKLTEREMIKRAQTNGQGPNAKKRANERKRQSDRD